MMSRLNFKVTLTLNKWSFRKAYVHNYVDFHRFGCSLVLTHIFQTAKWQSLSSYYRKASGY